MTATSKDTQGRRLYLRSCDYCNKGISVGYVWGNGSGYGCDGCYIKHLIEWTISLVDNPFFIKSDDKEGFIIEVSDQLYYGWTKDDDDGSYYGIKGNRVYDLSPLDEIVYGEEVYDPKTLNYEWVEQTKGEKNGQV